MNIFLKKLSVIFLLGAIMLVPSFIVGKMSSGKTIELRVEDFILLFLGITAFLVFLIKGKFKIKKPPFFSPILCWVLLGFVGVILNLILGNLIFADRALFYFFKEVEFLFLYFFVFYFLKDTDFTKTIIKFTLLFAVFNIVYVFYQIISHNQVGEYGTAALSEYGVFPTGAFFLLIFIFLFTIYIFYYNNLKEKLWKRTLFGLIAFSPIIGVFGSGSKTAFSALLFCSVVIFLLSLFKSKINKKKIIIVIIFVIILSVAFFAYSVAHIRSVSRIIDIFGFNKFVASYAADRFYYNQALLGEIIDKLNQQPLSIIFGLGVGYITEAHNQFIRNFAEIGVAGSLVFLFLIFLILKKGFRVYLKSEDLFSSGAGASIIVLTLAMIVFCFTTDPFFSVKAATTYWFFLGVNAAIISMRSKKDSKENKLVNVY